MLIWCRSSWAAHGRPSLGSLKGDPSETGISAIIHTHGLGVVLYMTSLIK